MHRRRAQFAVPSLAVFGFLFLSQTPATAQSFPGSAENDTNALIRELNTLLDRGEQERLIDPWFLRDLRTALSRYDRPWTEILLSDDFSARGPQPDPPWQVTAGEFLIDWRHGLRSVVEKSGATTAQSSGGGQTDEKDLGKALLGALLQGALQGQQQGGNSQQGQPTQTGPSFSAIQAPLRLSNAFAIDMTLSLRALQRGGDDGFELGPYQGANASGGYRLSYIAGDSAAGSAGSLQLLKVSSRGGVATIEFSNRPIQLLDGQPHSLSWTRDRDGLMAISIDGVEVMRVTDRSFRDPFDGFAVLNRGGDIALRDITIAGVAR